MGSPGTDPETMLARTTVVSLALQALMERLLLKGVLTAGDLTAMRGFGLDLVDGLRAHGATGPQVGADRLEREVMAWWEVVASLQADGGARHRGRSPGTREG